MKKAKSVSGEPASENEVIQNGRRTAVRNGVIDRWMRKEVLPIYDAIAARRSNAVSANEAWARIAAHIGSGKRSGG
ncbi:type II toxin-antitoxin system ParD family antitoxin [Bosea sp. LjRoot237]|uniref:type II toxin-antitoxin system ParD family antitoxin n=1 Tax=Bosea sp. LjRoot237 TaxID=3342292 RepID=UPI003ECD2467